jgi:hypothetical protein
MAAAFVLVVQHTLHCLGDTVCRCVDCSWLKSCRQLQDLNLESPTPTAALIHWQALSQLQQLTALGIRNFKLPGCCLSIIWSLHSLQALTLATNDCFADSHQLSGITALKWLRSLEYVMQGVDGYEQEEAAMLPIGSLTGLQRMTMYGLVSQPLITLVHLTYLKTMAWYPESREQVTMLTSLTDLQFLECGSVPLMWVGVQHLTRLTCLHIGLARGLDDECRIPHSQLSTFSVLTGLKHLHFDRCLCSLDLSPLQALTGLTYLALRGYAHLQSGQLRALGVALTNLQELDVTATSTSMMQPIQSEVWEVFGHLGRLLVSACNWMHPRDIPFLLALPSLYYVEVAKGLFSDGELETLRQQTRIQIKVKK